MLTNCQAVIESPAVTDQAAPPPNWYTDPADESQYRYWDGSAWTEHRAPRHVEEVRKTLRGPGRLLGDSFSLLRRQWRGCALPVLLLIAAQLLAVVLFFYSGDLVLMGEFDEDWARLSDPSTTPEDDAYFESLEFDFAVLNFVPAAIGGLLFWLASNLLTAVAALLTLGELRGETITASKVLRQASRRVLRILGLDLQLLLAVLIVAIIALAAATAPLLLFLVIPAVLITVFWSIAIVSLAYVVASVGPAESSLRYAFRLVRGRFWGTLGRLLLVSVVVMVISVVVMVISLVISAVTPWFGSFWALQELINAAMSAVLALLAVIASAILYFDLGGESD